MAVGKAARWMATVVAERTFARTTSMTCSRMTRSASCSASTVTGGSADSRRCGARLSSRRGRNRHAHREALMRAMEELRRVVADLATIEEDGRREGALPGWFYEIDIELEDEGDQPKVQTTPDDDGGNPFFDDNSDY